MPRRPGPLRRLDDELEPTQDDLDEAIAELFGPEPTDRAGRADLVLVVLGAIIAALSLVSGGGALLIVGGLMIALGLALPLQAGIRSVRRRRLSARETRILAAGYPLDVTDPLLESLARAYTKLREIGDGRDDQVARLAPVRLEDALEAGHLALVEAATLLGGRPLLAEAEKSYVRKRTAAINRLTRALREAAEAAERDAEAGEPQIGSLARARAELEAETGMGSLENLGTLTQIARRGLDATGR